MKNRYGFTIVELAIVIAIMGVLLVLGVAKLNASQETARNNERAGDVANIARFMEDYYKNNHGTYPATDKITSATMENFFDGLDKSSLKAPGQSSYSLIASDNTNPTIDQYVYYPQIDQRGSGSVPFGTCPLGSSVCGLCTDSTSNCRAFTLYYRTEGNGGEVKTIESENR